jgi:hypothetical protein
MHMLLRRYVPNPFEFRGFMREQNCVLSGLAVLWLIEGFPTSWRPTYITLWVPNGAIHDVKCYLQGLGYKQSDWQPKSRKSGSNSMIKYINEEAVEISVVESTSVNPIVPVTRFSLTIQMNYLEPDFLVLLYPALIFARVCVVQNITCRYPPNWMIPLNRRGWTFCQQGDWVPNWVSRSNIVFPGEKRDRRTLIVPMTRDCILLPSNRLPRFDVYPTSPREFPFDPSCHQFCAPHHHDLQETYKLALAALHSPHILY